MHPVSNINNNFFPLDRYGTLYRLFDGTFRITILISIFLNFLNVVATIVLSVIFSSKSHMISSNNYGIFISANVIQIFLNIHFIARYCYICIIPMLGEQDDDTLSNFITPRFKCWVIWLMYLLSEIANIHIFQNLIDPPVNSKKLFIFHIIIALFSILIIKLNYLSHMFVVIGTFSDEENNVFCCSTKNLRFDRCVKYFKIKEFLKYINSLMVFMFNFTLQIILFLDFSCLVIVFLSQKYLEKLFLIFFVTTIFPVLFLRLVSFAYSDGLSVCCMSRPIESKSLKIISISTAFSCLITIGNTVLFSIPGNNSNKSLEIFLIIYFSLNFINYSSFFLRFVMSNYQELNNG